MAERTYDLVLREPYDGKKPGETVSVNEGDANFLIVRGYATLKEKSGVLGPDGQPAREPVTVKAAKGGKEEKSESKSVKKTTSIRS